MSVPTLKLRHLRPRDPEGLSVVPEDPSEPPGGQLAIVSQRLSPGGVWGPSRLGLGFLREQPWEL